MSISFSAPQRFKAGNVFINMVRATVSSDDKYATGGYAITPKDVGLEQIIGILGVFSTGHVVVYANNKIKACDGAAEETSESTDLQNATADLVVLGR